MPPTRAPRAPASVSAVRDDSSADMVLKATEEEGDLVVEEEGDSVWEGSVY